MQIHLIDVLCNLAGLLSGAVIGLGFGLLQKKARQEHERLEQSGQLKNAWTLMPGSGARVAYLLLALVLAQVVCPLLFAEGTQWWVSGGLVAGYAVQLYQQLRLRMREARA